MISDTEEGKRLAASTAIDAPWRIWGPYLSERQWGVVREDYSANGDAWNYFPHDHARSRAYRWGEDGIAGISDTKQRLCFATALWNGKDPILKERLFGLTNNEGNHGEDVKEYYYYLDNTPTHSYMKYLYKYPQSPFPYNDLLTTNRQRNRYEPEYELIDTKIFDDNRYFDVFIEYAKSDSEDILIRYRIANRGPEASSIYLLPHLWFRNTWSWEGGLKPHLDLTQGALHATEDTLGQYWLYYEGQPPALFTENETNIARLFQVPNAAPYVKDSFHDYFVHGCKTAVHPEQKGTKACLAYQLELQAGEEKIVKLRLTSKNALTHPFDKAFDALFVKRQSEANAFYQAVTPYPLPEDMRSIQRQAFAGLLWNKQCYHYNVRTWLRGDPLQPKPPEEREVTRNHEWPYLDAFEIFSMPDKWEYPWFAAWDLAFHTVTLAMIDPAFAKNQLLLLTREWYMAPCGQIPAYEWQFSDANPPVHAWAAMRVYQIEHAMYGTADRIFLEKMFHKLLLNFTWWVNRKDSQGRNIFEGGFMGLDNIGAFDRSLQPPTGGILEQTDATGWMGMYCLNCLQIALELAIENPVYEDMATKFFEHFVYIADAINNVTGQSEGLWDRENGFYYGLLMLPDGRSIRMRQDTMTSVIPLFAVATNEAKIAHRFPEYRKRFHWFIENRPHMLQNIANLEKLGVEGRVLLAFANSTKLMRVLKKVLNSQEFLSPFGIRSVSKRHATEPFVVHISNQVFRLDYEPAESTTGLFGGNSNWRGPIWLPLNFLLIESLQKFHYYFGDDLKVECPTGSGSYLNLWEVASELSKRIVNIFLKDEHGRRPVYGSVEKFQTDPHFNGYIPFHEYFHGDSGCGLGASHQTGWTALVAKLIQQYGKFVLQHEPAATIEKEKIGLI